LTTALMMSFVQVPDHHCK